MRSKHVRRIFGALLIILSLVVASYPTDTVNAETGTKSETKDFQMNKDVLVKYTGTAETVSVPNTVKEIGEEAFANNTGMVELVIPSSVEKISYAAFSGCNNLKKVILPDSVIEIGTAAFCNCKELTEVSIGKGVEKFGTGVFTGCSRLSTISGNDNFICSDGAIYDKDCKVLYEVLQNAKVKKDASSNDYVNMTEYVMPKTVEDIKPYALYGCRHIESIRFSNYIEEIPAYSFSYCNSLTKLDIPYNIGLIDVKAFEYCINLSDVNIPLTTTFIHKTAFDGCPKLNIIAPDDSYASEWFKNHDNTEVNIIDTEDSEEEEDVSANSQLPKIDGLIGETVIVGRQAVFFLDSSDLVVKSGKYADPEAYSDIVSQMESVLQTETNGKGLSLPKFSVINNKIAGRAYYGDTSLTSYEFPENISSIEDFAFARTPLTEVTVPQGVTSIGYGAFYHCDDLSRILVPATVEYIGPSAFAKTRMMDNWLLYGESNFLIMGDGILVAYKGTGNSVTVPDTVKKIGPEAFKDNKQITEVIIPESVTDICEEAFYGCSGLSNISGGMNVARIEDRAFYGCPLKTVRIAENVKSVGLGAFSYNATSISDSYKNVVFQGDILPKVSCNKTTSRLTNSQYRIDAFDGVNVAIVNSESVDRVGTVLDRSVSGFSGLVCLISEPSNEYFNGTLKIIDCTLTADEAGRINIPSSVTVYGKGYNFIEDELNSVLTMAMSGAYFEETDAVLTVSFEGSKDEYVLNIAKDEKENPLVKDAYIRIYGNTVPANFTTYVISLYDSNTDCNITKFGKQKLPVSIPIPDNMPTTNLHVICIDEDEQLEDLPFEVVGTDDGLVINFEISHTGNYGLYSFNSTSVSLFKLDDSPDTGDYIHPKWFLAIGLFALGLLFIFLKDRVRIKSED